MIFNILEIIKERQQALGRKIFYDGQVPSNKRVELVDELMQVKVVFLISLKAGGTRLNLTGQDRSNTLIMVGLGKVEDQATDELTVWSKRNAKVFRLVTIGSIERSRDTKQSKNY